MWLLKHNYRKTMENYSLQRSQLCPSYLFHQTFPCLSCHALVMTSRSPCQRSYMVMSACLRHSVLLGSFKSSLYYVPLKNTQIHSPLLLAKSNLDGRARKRATRQEGEHPVAAITCCVCFLRQTASWIRALRICPLVSATYRNQQSILPRWRLMQGKEHIPWEQILH